MNYFDNAASGGSFRPRSMDYLGDVSSGGSFRPLPQYFDDVSSGGSRPETLHNQRAWEASRIFDRDSGAPSPPDHEARFLQGKFKALLANQVPHAEEFAGTTQKLPFAELEAMGANGELQPPNIVADRYHANQYAGTPSATAAPPPAAASTPSDAQVQGMMKMAGLLSPPQDDKPPTMTAPGVIPGRAPFAGQDFQLGAGRKRQYFVPQGFLR
jgi:hypothetical protein